MFTCRIVDAHTLLALYETRAPANCHTELAEWRLDYAERRVHIKRIATLATNVDAAVDVRQWNPHCIVAVGGGKLVVGVCGGRKTRYDVYEVDVAACSSRVLGGFELMPLDLAHASHFADGQFYVLHERGPDRTVGLCRFDVATATLSDVHVDSQRVVGVSIYPPSLTQLPFSFSVRLCVRACVRAFVTLVNACSRSRALAK